MSDDPYLPEKYHQDADGGEAGAPRERPGCLTPGCLTIVFLLLTVLYLVYFGILLVNPYVPINPFPPRTPLPVILVATIDPNPPTGTPTPTKMLETPRLNTLAPTSTPTITPSQTAIIQPSATVVVGDLPSLPTATMASPTPSLVSGPEVASGGDVVFTPPPPGDPAAYTRAPYPFTIYGDQVEYIENPGQQGCRWASVAGSVTNLEGQPVAGLAVHIVGEGVDEIRFTGTAPAYGPGGFEIFLNGAPLRGQYVVQLLSQTGTPISDEFPLITSPVCEENVAIVNFVQNFEY